MKLLERLFGSPPSVRDEIPLDELQELKGEAQRNRDRADEAIRRYAPEVQRRADFEEYLRRDGPARAIRDAQRRIDGGR